MERGDIKYPYNALCLALLRHLNTNCCLHCGVLSHCAFETQMTKALETWHVTKSTKSNL